MVYRWYAAAYHWTPDQVDNLDLEHVDWLAAIEIAEREAQHLMSKPKPGADFGPGLGGFGGS